MMAFVPPAGSGGSSVHGSAELLTAQSELLSCIREYARFSTGDCESSETLSEEKRCALADLEQEIINAAFQLNEASEVYRRNFKSSLLQRNGEIFLPKTIGQKPACVSASSKSDSGPLQLPKGSLDVQQQFVAINDNQLRWRNDNYSNAERLLVRSEECQAERHLIRKSSEKTLSLLAGVTNSAMPDASNQLAPSGTSGEMAIGAAQIPVSLIFTPSSADAAKATAECATVSAPASSTVLKSESAPSSAILPNNVFFGHQQRSFSPLPSDATTHRVSVVSPDSTGLLTGLKLPVTLSNTSNISSIDGSSLPPAFLIFKMPSSSIPVGGHAIHQQPFDIAAGTRQQQPTPAATLTNFNGIFTNGFLSSPSTATNSASSPVNLVNGLDRLACSSNGSTAFVSTPVASVPATSEALSLVDRSNAFDRDERKACTPSPCSAATVGGASSNAVTFSQARGIYPGSAFTSRPNGTTRSSSEHVPLPSSRMENNDSLYFANLNALATTALSRAGAFSHISSLGKCLPNDTANGGDISAACPRTSSGSTSDLTPKTFTVEKPLAHKFGSNTFPYCGVAGLPAVTVDTGVLNRKPIHFRTPPMDSCISGNEQASKTREHQALFLGNFGLCTHERFRELSERRRGRARRKTANPHFSAAAVEERRRIESLRRKKKAVVPDGKTKLQHKEDLEQRAERLKNEQQTLLKKHEEARQRLFEERSRGEALSRQHQEMEEKIGKLRNFVTLLTEATVCT